MLACCCTLCKDYPCIIQMLTSMALYLVAVQKWHCNAYSKNLLFQRYASIAPQLPLIG